MRLQPYKHYKPSGCEWLAEVPAHWTVKRLKYSASINDEALPETTDPDLELTYIDIGSVDQINGIVATEDMVFENAPSRARRIVTDGDTIVSTVRTYLRAIAPIRNPKPNTIVSTGFAVVRPRKVAPGYLAYALREVGFVEAIVARSVGVSYPAINASEVGTIPIPIPSIAEQAAIAKFLDRETAKIDTLVAKKRTLIERLREKRTALISRTVTRGLPPDAARAAGLDPHPKLKRSGVDWLGGVPAHWDVVPLKWSARTASGDGISADDVVGTSDDENNVPVIGGNGLMGFTHQANIDSSCLVIGRVGALCGNVHEVDAPAWVTDNALVLDVDKGTFDIHFLASVLRARNLNELAAKTAQPLITGSQVRDQRVPCPPRKEQENIARFLDAATAEVDVMAANVDAVVERLQEYRTALIAAVVTGKIDVREAAA